jgi:hypothetical protein
MMPTVISLITIKMFIATTSSGTVKSHVVVIRSRIVRSIVIADHVVIEPIIIVLVEVFFYVVVINPTLEIFYIELITVFLMYKLHVFASPSFHRDMIGVVLIFMSGNIFFTLLIPTWCVCVYMIGPEEMAMIVLIVHKWYILMIIILEGFYRIRSGVVIVFFFGNITDQLIEFRCPLVYI